MTKSVAMQIDLNPCTGAPFFPQDLQDQMPHDRPFTQCKDVLPLVTPHPKSYHIHFMTRSTQATLGISLSHMTCGKYDKVLKTDAATIQSLISLNGSMPFVFHSPHGLKPSYITAHVLTTHQWRVKNLT